MPIRRLLIMICTLWFAAHACSQSALRLAVGPVVDAAQLRRIPFDSCFIAIRVPADVRRRMQGKSFPAQCGVKWTELRYLRVLHRNANGQPTVGELVCNSTIAADLLNIFRELYRMGYPIESMRLIDDFNADDERSMRANNTSAFCYRGVAGTKRLSKHSRGLAIDINPLYNPCVRQRRNGTTSIQPTTAARYADRHITTPYTITAGSDIVRLFRKHGFRWGGEWRSVKDWQHFEK